MLRTRDTVQNVRPRLYAIALGWPEDGAPTIKSLAEGSAADRGAINSVRMLGSDAPLLPDLARVALT